ncbi:MAG: hypothetical protein ACQEQC_03965 [Elusimicrobiota bacterium]
MILPAVLLGSSNPPLKDKYFLGEEPGSYALGRGGAFSAVMATPFAPYWNPGGLQQIENNRFGISANIINDSDIDQNKLADLFILEEKKINFLSVCASQVGVYYRPLSNRADTYNTDTQSKELHVNLNQYGVTVSVEHAENVNFGMNINYLSGMSGYSVIESSSPEVTISKGYGWGLDWGLIYEASEFVNVGVTLLNGPAQFYWEEFDTNYLPLIVKTGLDVQLSQLMSLGINYENGLYDDTVTGKNDLLRLGIEHYLGDNFVARAGIYGTDLEDKYKSTYTGGIGYKKENYLVDIAMRQFYLRENTEQVRRFSISGVIPF